MMAYPWLDGSMWPYITHGFRPYHEYPLGYNSGSALHRFIVHEHNQMRELERQLSNIKVSKDNSYVAIECNVAGYEPKELKVALEGNELLIEGEHSDSTESQTINRTFTRRIKLPATIDHNSIQCHIDEKGQLTVSAEQVQKEKSSSRQIPITDKKAVENAAQLAFGK